MHKTNFCVHCITNNKKLKKKIENSNIEVLKRKQRGNLIFVYLLAVLYHLVDHNTY